jgi:hypothetical protein
MIEAIQAVLQRAAEAVGLASKEGMAKLGVHDVGKPSAEGDASNLAVGGDAKSVFAALGVDAQALRAEVKAAAPPEQIACRNADLEGQRHPKVEVYFRREIVQLRDGRKVEGVFPVFKDAFECRIPESLERSSDYKQMKDCNAQLAKAVQDSPELQAKFSSRQLEQIANGDTPDRYVWHHHQQVGKMQLVRFEDHQKAAHLGGKEIWGGGREHR